MSETKIMLRHAPTGSRVRFACGCDGDVNASERTSAGQPGVNIGGSHHIRAHGHIADPSKPSWGAVPTATTLVTLLSGSPLPPCGREGCSCARTFATMPRVVQVGDVVEAGDVPVGAVFEYVNFQHLGRFTRLADDDPRAIDRLRRINYSASDFIVMLSAKTGAPEHEMRRFSCCRLLSLPSSPSCESVGPKRKPAVECIVADCGGCSCHINPPCSHCEMHTGQEEDEEPSRLHGLQ